MVLAALAGACLSATACAPQAEAPGSPAGGAGTSAPRTDTYDLRGKWSVSRLGGRTLSHRIELEGSADALTWQPACAGQGISYRTSGDGLEFYQPPRDEPQFVCKIAYPQALPQVINALEGRWQVAEHANGDLRLTRGDETITLEKLPVDMVETLAGEWRVAGVDGREFDEPYGLALSASESEIWWNPRCARQSLGYRIEGTRFVFVPPSEMPKEQLVVCVIAIPPRLPEVMSAIRSADRIERTPENGILLSGGGHSVTLFSQ